MLRRDHRIRLRSVVSRGGSHCVSVLVVALPHLWPFDFVLGQWTSLQVYLDDGRVEIDNNLVENAIRPTAIGKKNWLFIGEADAGERSAILYTIIECCRRRAIDPYAYLRNVLTRLPHMTNRQIPEVIPSAWDRTPPQVHRQLS